MCAVKVQSWLSSLPVNEQSRYWAAVAAAAVVLAERFVTHVCLCVTYKTLERYIYYMCE